LSLSINEYDDDDDDDDDESRRRKTPCITLTPGSRSSPTVCWRQQQLCRMTAAAGGQMLFAHNGTHTHTHCNYRPASITASNDHEFTRTVIFTADTLCRYIEAAAVTEHTRLATANGRRWVKQYEHMYINLPQGPVAPMVGRWTWSNPYTRHLVWSPRKIWLLCVISCGRIPKSLMLCKTVLTQYDSWTDRQKSPIDIGLHYADARRLPYADMR